MNKFIAQTSTQAIVDLKTTLTNEEILNEIVRIYHKCTSVPYGVLFVNAALEGELFEKKRFLATEAAELRASGYEAYINRNVKAVNICYSIGWINKQVKEVTGHNLLSRMYDFQKITIRQKHISEAIEMITEFVELCDELSAMDEFKNEFAM